AGGAARAVGVGGREEAVGRARPLLEVLGDPERTWHLGPVGAGQAAKLMVNLVLGGVTAAVAEGFILGRVLGLSPEDALDVLEGASVASQTVRSKRDKLQSGDYGDPGFRLALMHKDLRLALDAARAARATLPGTERVAELYAGAKGRGLADQDYAAVAAYLAGMAPLLEHASPEGQGRDGAEARPHGRWSRPAAQSAAPGPAHPLGPGVVRAVPAVPA